MSEVHQQKQDVGEAQSIRGLPMSRQEDAVTSPQLVHIAVRTQDPAGLAAFYEQVFEMKIVRTGRGAVDLCDGRVFLALNPPSHSGWTGLEHFGFLVKDVEALGTPLRQAGASEIKARPAGRSFTDWRVHDPEGNPIDLSARGYNTVPAEEIGGIKADEIANINELVIASEAPSKLAQFYEKVFEMEIVRQKPNVVVLSDGKVNLVLLSSAQAAQKGLLSFGFRKGAGNGISKRLREIGLSVSAQPAGLGATDSQFSLRDSAGNLLTFSEGMD
jgi:catechol 2,3-dioxygenase-like lactoylglutathione lyase family enzyme